jgi:hypothetical protein
MERPRNARRAINESFMSVLLDLEKTAHALGAGL